MVRLPPAPLPLAWVLDARSGARQVDEALHLGREGWSVLRSGPAASRISREARAGEDAGHQESKLRSWQVVPAHLEDGMGAGGCSVGISGVLCAVTVPRVSMPNSCVGVGLQRGHEGAGAVVSPTRTFPQQKGSSSDVTITPMHYHHCPPNRIQDIPKLPGEGIPEGPVGPLAHLAQVLHLVEGKSLYHHC